MTLVLTKHLSTLLLLLSTAANALLNSCNLSIAALLIWNFSLFLQLHPRAAAIAADVADEREAIPKRTVADAAIVTLVTSLITPVSLASSVDLVSISDFETSRRDEGSWRDEASLTSCFSVFFFIDLMHDASSIVMTSYTGRPEKCGSSRRRQWREANVTEDGTGSLRVWVGIHFGPLIWFNLNWGRETNN